ncbi:radical SAM family heme chaperone HemW [Cyanobacterium aponinum]|uniref:Heme chaperone HemW n=1 Tax=Cyanobacterium aponinum 0216 TaxID=2676140 RepID=A0A844GS93_9CHRO|nr:radical SAM family heme chaperone HemW [Cyanobacterium aponinum]MTF37932.1 coproporphyrinogen III oxidase [Cyanobacterium aponinum 0216]PHV61354.1 coproporphyrinogen III oxidase [Cyanobacterium aponinum IPPAS B-1201]
MSINSAYLHIPFCRRRCFYCDFPITVLGDNGGNTYSNWQKEYVDFICQEIIVTSKCSNQPLDTVFFGGGTPSLLALEGLETILNTLNNCFGINQKAEISLEIDPATFNLEKLKSYKKLGVNRISLGIQAFQDNLLEFSGRTHRVKDIYEGVEWINVADFENWSLDLISGLPYQTLNDWLDSLEKAIALSPKHISCYDLVLEPTTVFGKKYQEGDNPLPMDEITAQMYRLASEKLGLHFYEHYEISNYAQKGYECRHNQVYWLNQSYYGFGMGAASYVNNIRFTRPRTRQEYFKWVEQLKANQGKIEAIVTSKNEQILETLMLGLRLKKGVNLSELKSQFGEYIETKIIDCLKNHIETNLVIFDPHTLQLRLSDPDGFLYSNQVLTALFREFDDEG